MRLHSEQQAGPRRGNPKVGEDMLIRGQPERGSKGFWNAKQPDRHPSSREGTRIASQPLCPRKPIVGALGTRKRRRFDREAGRSGRFDLDLDALMAQELYACTSVVPTAPVAPEQGHRADSERMQEYAHLARLRSSTAIPLTLVAQEAGATTANAGSIHDAQAPIGFSAMFLDTKRSPGWTAQRPIWLDRKVSSGEATSFPGGGYGRWSIPSSNRST